MTDDQQADEEATMEVWGRVESWLEHNAPRSHARLPHPATEDEIRAVEQELDLIIPPALRAFYRLHNGTGPADDFVWPYEGATAYLLPDGYGLCPVSRLARWRQDEPFFEEPEPHHRSLIFGGTDPDGVTGIYADCTPGADFGAVGLFEEASHLTENIWPSFSDYLREVADVLDGERRFDPKVGGERTYRPEVNGGVLAWTWH